MLTYERRANSIIRVPFTGSVKLRSLLLKSGPGDQTPAKVKLVSVCLCAKTPKTLTNLSLQFANVDNFDFEDADKEPLQELDVAVGREVGEYAVK
jgi:hypothetical protein